MSAYIYTLRASTKKFQKDNLISRFSVNHTNYPFLRTNPTPTILHYYNSFFPFVIINQRTKSTSLAFPESIIITVSTESTEIEKSCSTSEGIFTNRVAVVLYVTLNVLREAVRAAREMMIEEILQPLLVYVAIKHPPNLARGRGTR